MATASTVQIQGVRMFDQRHICSGLMVLPVQSVVTRLQQLLISEPQEPQTNTLTARKPYLAKTVDGGHACCMTASYA